MQEPNTKSWNTFRNKSCYRRLIVTSQCLRCCCDALWNNAQRSAFADSTLGGTIRDMEAERTRLRFCRPRHSRPWKNFAHPSRTEHFRNRYLAAPRTPIYDDSSSWLYKRR
ncbi:hypothetical protein HBI56_170470 [Parastagonospora nodorum]|uniref:Uncharacterized protein n=1 Tax=Phaeosphaeria nodorum (strain SN15 / ATCC MYA-4574 / FGSC 10173) TaxID=321614 RepID=A0A7U2FFD7_PHANO|nr:hypothetical protein HBH56_245000 [Parastagonospora nodorum]QRD01901.1 hypothetical protein JI435_417350 [Parastagonospora nodorum SN15]KAH3935592.1 hypothetical protein HBH54_034060 [Parastagonospora nodorum]KAH3938691.1 hypothetical protein HBH53_247410 [Parastagonospora nodorum]KAH3964201.1 hypothetical protein HBH51_159920 [Parastagonospora nodorum]